MNENIHILFNEVQPEYVLERLRTNDGVLGSFDDFRRKTFQEYSIGNSTISRKAYTHFARNRLQHASDDDIYYLYEELQQHIKRKKHESFLSLIADYAEKVLVLKRGIPFCINHNIMEWRDISFDLGQDLFTTSLLAKRHLESGYGYKNFSWPSIIQTDDTVVFNILNEGRGIAENHFHLTGSTPVFSMAWAYMMNNPFKAKRLFERDNFQEYLRSGGPVSVFEHLSWKDLIFYAAYARLELFNKFVVKNKIEIDFVEMLNEPFFNKSDILKKMDNVRSEYSAKFKQYNSKPICLDYAITKELHYDNSHYFRSLSGERNLLYKCFVACYSNRMTNAEKDIFYFYITCMQRMRSEYIQVNKRKGFANFLSYQDRKDILWGDDSAYWSEAMRMVLCGTLNAEPIRSLEMRMVPKASAVKCVNGLKQIGQLYDFHTAEMRSRGKDSKLDTRYHVVYHFIKSRGEAQKEVMGDFIKCRNFSVRDTAREQAAAILEGIGASKRFREMISGIDAASSEIGCRPETFATEFRHVRLAASCLKDSWCGEARSSEIAITYHAGEDFLCFVDGLRCIDEAILFLNMKSGDRLGHALALGVDPKIHYKIKSRYIAIPKQELVDNIIWVLFRCSELGIELSDSLKWNLQSKAKEFVKDIYNPKDLVLNNYFSSWKLRGDHPDIYQNIDLSSGGGYYKYVNEALQEIQFSRYQYSKSVMLENDKLEIERKKDGVLEFIYKYHFSKETREKGDEIVKYEIDTDFLDIVIQIQNKLMTNIEERDICIECNPSSNKLIGTFGEYRYHPIFRFNNHYISDYPVKHKPNAQLRVSINTDDQGVFDTSLENEYALIYAVLREQKNAKGQRLIDDYSAQDYIKHIKNMGVNMTFNQFDDAFCGDR